MEGGADACNLLLVGAGQGRAGRLEQVFSYRACNKTGELFRGAGEGDL